MASRMKGTVGFGEDILGIFTAGDRACMGPILRLTDWSQVRRSAREILRRVTLDPSDPDHMPVGRTLPQAQIDLISAWIDEGTPKARGEGYASYFRDLDAVTEYFDVYGRPQSEYLMPQVFKYFGQNDVPGRRKALNIWQSYAVIPDDDPTKAAEKQALDQELAQAEVTSAVKTVDAALLGFVRTHWSSAAGVDNEIMFDAFLRFGADRLAEDADRLARIKALNDPNDSRLGYAQFHRMDGLVMWMNWMGHVECAVTLFGNQDPDHKLRTALMAALCLGYSADCVFRTRGQTFPDYYRPDGEDRMWRKTVLIANDFDKARAESHALARLRESKPLPAMVAADVPVRFRSIRQARQA